MSIAPAPLRRQEDPPPVVASARARRGPARSAAGILAIPGLVLLAVFSLAPFILLIVQSFGSAGSAALSLESFSNVLGNPQYLGLLVRSLSISLLVTVLSIGVAWPVAWAIAKHVSPRHQSTLLALVIVPVLTSQLLLIYGMLVLLSAGGPLMSFLATLHLASASDSIVYTPLATIVMFVYESISVIVLVLFIAAERIDDRLLAASRSLGGGTVRTFFTVIWPASSTALISAVSITFVATAGAFAEASILGGPNGSMLGNVIADRIENGGDEHVTAALAVVLLVSSLIAVALLAVVIRRIATPASDFRTDSRRIL